MNRPLCLVAAMALCMVPAVRAGLELDPLNLGRLELDPQQGGPTFYDMDVSGEWAFVAAGTGGVKIVNLANALNPQFAGTWSVPNAQRVAAANGFLCVGAGQVLFVASLANNVAAPVPLGSVLLSSTIESISIGNGHAFIALGGFGDGFAVVNLGTSPPQVVGGFGLTGFAVGGAWRGGRFVVATRSPARFHVINVTTPGDPSVMGSTNLPVSTPVSVVLSGSGAYVYSGGSVVPISLASFSSPEAMPLYESSSGNFLAGASLGSGLFAAPFANNTLLLDLAEPLAPVRAGYVFAKDSPASAYPGIPIATGWTTDGELVTLTNTGRLQMLDVTRTTRLPSSSREGALVIEHVEAARVLYIPFFYRYFCLAERNLFRADDTPAPVDTLNVGLLNTTTISGQRIFVASDNPGLRIFSIADPDTPALLATMPTIGDATAIEDVAASGSLAVAVSRDPGRLFTLDVSDPSMPAVTGTLSFPPADALSVRLVGTTVWFTHQRGNVRGLQAVDVSNPASPAFRGDLLLPQGSFALPYDFEIVGTTAYVAGSGAGLFICDVSNPLAPALLSHLPLQGLTFDVTVAGDYAYVATAHAGLQVVDISDPFLPQWVAANGSFTARNVSNIFGFVFVAGYRDGLITVPLYDPGAVPFGYTLRVQQVTAANVSLVATGGKNERMVVDWSSDLNTWHPWHEPTAGSGGTALFTKPRPDPAQAFFRLRH